MYHSILILDIILLYDELNIDVTRICINNLMYHDTMIYQYTVPSLVIRDSHIYEGIYTRDLSGYTRGA